MIKQLFNIINNFFKSKNRNQLMKDFVIASGYSFSKEELEELEKKWNNPELTLIKTVEKILPTNEHDEQIVDNLIAKKISKLKTRKI